MGVYYEEDEVFYAQCSNVCADESCVNKWGGGALMEMTMKMSKAHL